MLTLIALFILYLGLAIWVWRSTPPLIVPSQLESEEFSLCYTTTQLRRASVFFTSCALFTTLMVLINYSISYALWDNLLANWLPEEFHYLIYLVVAVVLIQLARLPIILRFLLDACSFFQRYQFFPTLPTAKESNLMAQLDKLPLVQVPQEIESILKHEPMLSDDQIARAQHAELYEKYKKLEVIYTELSLLAKTKRPVVKRFYFGQDWEIIVSLYREIDRKMHDNTTDMNAMLAHKIRLCLYYCYGLLTRVIMETSVTSDDAKEWFKRCGFEMDQL